MATPPSAVKAQQKAIQKADTLIEALGWIRKFRDTTTVIQLGGSVVETEPLPGGVTFYSDGTCTAFRLQIRLNGGASIIAIDPWTCAPVIPRAPNP